MNRLVYDLQFNEAELTQINRLRTLDDNRRAVAWVLGLGTFMAVFCSQIPFYGTAWLHALATYGCIPAGLVVGIIANRKIDSFVERRFINKWDPLYYQRKGTTAVREAAREEILRVTDSSWFYGLSKAEQKAEMKKINRKYGLE